VGELGSNQPTYNRPAVLAHGSWVQIPPPPLLAHLLVNCIPLVKRLLVRPFGCLNQVPDRPKAAFYAAAIGGTQRIVCQGFFVIQKLN
jgi:hypothetical protein